MKKSIFLLFFILVFGIICHAEDVVVDARAQIVYGSNQKEVQEAAAHLSEVLGAMSKETFSVGRDVKTPETNFEIVMHSAARAEAVDLQRSMQEGDYAVKVVRSPEKTSIVIAYRGRWAGKAATDAFLSQITMDGKTMVVSEALDIAGHVDANAMIVESGIKSLRDPCVLLEDGVYYVYGTGWNCYYSENLEGPYTGPVYVAEKPKGYKKQPWAPEVHKYNGAYYMFTTYYSSETEHRGCTIMKADNPLGPFREITNGHITPHNIDAIDGTLYIDKNGQPWMVFVREWTATGDNVGRMSAAKLNEDFTAFEGEITDLFRADDPLWTDRNVTDGCWMYETENGELLMLWSNFTADGYVVGVARSESGNVLGPWTHDNDLLFSSELTGNYDGGHGMLFYDKTGQMYLSVHSPNTATDTRGSMPVFVRVKEKDGTLIWDMHGEQAGFMTCARSAGRILIYPIQGNEDKLFAVYGEDEKLIAVLCHGGVLETEKREPCTIKALEIDINGKTIELETQVLK